MVKRLAWRWTAGMSGGTCYQVTLTILDQFLCLFVIFPLCIFHWRGTWHLQDVYLMPHDYVLSSWLSLIYGVVLGIILALIHPSLVRFLKKYRRWAYVVGIRIYLYISGWAILGYWRGLWNLVDYYLTEGWVNSVIIYAIAQVISLLSRTSRANAGLPLSINIDVDEDLDHPDTRFYKTVSISAVNDVSNQDVLSLRWKWSEGPNHLTDYPASVTVTQWG